MAKTWTKKNINIANIIGVDAIIADTRKERYDRRKAEQRVRRERKLRKYDLVLAQ